MFGPLDLAPSKIKLRYATLKLECEGKQVSFFRGIDKNTALSINECSLDGKIESSQKVPLDLEAMDFKYSQVGAMIDVNGESRYRNTY